MARPLNTSTPAVLARSGAAPPEESRGLEPVDHRPTIMVPGHLEASVSPVGYRQNCPTLSEPAIVRLNHDQIRRYRHELPTGTSDTPAASRRASGRWEIDNHR
jgi:hypothetical protein